jgi:Uma2 family endonuclease
MADNTLQFEWIARIKGGLDALYRDDPDVFVAGNLMWYPVEGNNRRRLAPDAMVIFGRPKGYRGSYVQHEEGGIAPQVVFEVWSPGNRRRVMDYKRNFYRLHGVEEYYVFEPYKIQLEVWLGDGDGSPFRPVAKANGWVSPRMGIRFELGEDLTIFAPDGRPFEDFAEVARQRDDLERQAAEQRKLAARERRLRARSERQAEEERNRAEEERRKADEEHRLRAESDQKADAEREKADAERKKADVERRRAEEEQKRADEERRLREESERRAERLAARLRELGLEPEE